MPVERRACPKIGVKKENEFESKMTAGESSCKKHCGRGSCHIDIRDPAAGESNGKVTA
jgi:hypothetical protein